MLLYTTQVRSGVLEPVLHIGSSCLLGCTPLRIFAYISRYFFPQLVVFSQSVDLIVIVFVS